ncbi:Hypothetical predicted protein [Podarcis lilfordi]|uniref:Uncharacterized protein n=1 Tax=Podarcis lilfordi TaxID=74358 RepID=A0AA35LG24_9SAUR|nr:Hypothetical predicted protein [Podarcis lilfordi]
MQDFAWLLNVRATGPRQNDWAGVGELKGGRGGEKREWAAVGGGGGCPTSTDTALKALYIKRFRSLTPAVSGLGFALHHPTHQRRVQRSSRVQEVLNDAPISR